MGENTIKVRFESHILFGDCWIWTTSKNKAGYGYFGFKNKIQKSHRVSYQLYIGQIPENMKVLHRCDNPSCVNPNHLFLGTQSENVADMIKKGRQADRKAEKGTNRKLSPIQIRYVRIFRGITTTDIAKKFNISPGYVSKIRNNIHWTT